MSPTLTVYPKITKLKNIKREFIKWKRKKILKKLKKISKKN